MCCSIRLMLFAGSFMLAASTGVIGLAQEPAKQDREALFKKFSETLSGAKLVGNFTVIGQEKKDLAPEEYHIKSVRKLEKGNLWLFMARIKYGEHDVTVPMELEVQWAGDTPVVTMTDVAVPMLGSFSARVVFYNNKYAGTWSHDDVGGHLFGTIVPDAAEDSEESKRPGADSKDKGGATDDGKNK